jgi:hypothetical protein
MPQVTLRAKVDAKDALRKLSAIPMGLTKAALKSLKKAGEQVVEMMQVEPPPLPPRTQRGRKYPSRPYQRTGQYIGGWHTVAAKAQGVTVLNPVDYVKWVGGLLNVDTQARVHRGRWTLFRDAVAKVLGTVPDLVVRGFRRFQLNDYRDEGEE